MDLLGKTIDEYQIHKAYFRDLTREMLELDPVD